MIFYSRQLGKTHKFLESIKDKLESGERCAILGLIEPENYIKALKEDFGIEAKYDKAYNAWNRIDESDKKQIGVIIYI